MGDSRLRYNSSMPTSRKRVLTALSHQQPDRTPVDMLAVPEIWNKLLTHCRVETREDVRLLKRLLVQTLGQGGGYILAPSHHLQADTPLENVLAIYETNLR